MKSIAAVTCIALAAAAANAQTLSEGFDGSTLLPFAWSSVNNSANGLGTSPDWEQTEGSVLNWLPHSGTGYATIGYNATVGSGDISAFLISPVTEFKNGDTISFWTRTWEAPTYPDRLNVVLNTNGSLDPLSFTHNLLTINPNLTTTDYPTEWTQYTVTISGLPEAASHTGRFAFWYNPTDGGPMGSNSDRIGLDDVNFTSVPAPGPAALLGIGTLILARRKR